MRLVRCALPCAILLAASACKNKDAPRPIPRDAAVVELHVDWVACEAALRKAPTLPASTRAKAIIDACPVCGDWSPILMWGTPHDEGGPLRNAIEEAMLRCHAYCEPNAKQRFLGALDNARGANVRTPWRLLGDVCKAEVSSIPDNRFMSAPYFALDRIARAIGARDPKLLDGIVVPLPALTFSGVGVQLPAAEVVTPELPAVAITIIADVRLGQPPRARLTANGVVVDLGTPEPYPGALVTDLKAELAKLPTQPVVVLASAALPAAKVVDALRGAGSSTLFLGAAAPSAPQAWQIPGYVPVALRDAAAANAVKLDVRAGAVIEPPTGTAPIVLVIAPDATVADLAAALARVAKANRTEAAVIKAAK
jgi:hypothetical protein